MSTENALQAASQLLAPWTKESKTPEPTRLDVVIARDDLLACIGALKQARWGYLAAITGLDLGVASGELEALYHMCEGAAVVTLRVRTPRDNASVPSICDLLPSAALMERELAEMFGITVVGQNPEHFFLPEDWPANTFPLRKDYQVVPPKA